MQLVINTVIEFICVYTHPVFIYYLFAHFDHYSWKFPCYFILKQERRARALQQRLAAEARARRRAEKRALALVPEEGQ